MNTLSILTNLKVGQLATVNKLNTSGDVRRRLQDIGLIEGTPVECVLKSPGKYPIAYQIRGAIIALRSEDSNTVVVNL